MVTMIAESPVYTFGLDVLRLKILLDPAHFPAFVTMAESLSIQRNLLRFS